MKTVSPIMFCYSVFFFFFQTCWSFDDQISYFNSTVSDNLTASFTQEQLVHHLDKSVFFVSFGINDYYKNYLWPNNGTLKTLTPELFAQFLLNELAARLRVNILITSYFRNYWKCFCIHMFTCVKIEQRCHGFIDSISYGRKEVSGEQHMADRVQPWLLVVQLLWRNDKQEVVSIQRHSPRCADEVTSWTAWILLLMQWRFPVCWWLEE